MYAILYFSNLTDYIVSFCTVDFTTRFYLELSIAQWLDHPTNVRKVVVLDPIYKLIIFSEFFSHSIIIFNFGNNKK